LAARGIEGQSILVQVWTIVKIAGKPMSRPWQVMIGDSWGISIIARK
jgi:hypothetical protein